MLDSPKSSSAYTCVKPLSLSKMISNTSYTPLCALLISTGFWASGHLAYPSLCEAKWVWLCPATCDVISLECNPVMPFVLPVPSTSALLPWVFPVVLEELDSAKPSLPSCSGNMQCGEFIPRVYATDQCRDWCEWIHSTPFFLLRPSSL